MSENKLKLLNQRVVKTTIADTDYVTGWWAGEEEMKNITFANFRTAVAAGIGLIEKVPATETTIADFAAASAGYTFEQGDVIIITDTASRVILYMYMGGTKTDVANYTQIDTEAIATIKDAAGVLSADFENRTLNDTAGAISFDYENRVINDSSVVESADFESRQLHNAAGAAVLDYALYQLSAADASLSLNWDTRLLQDSSSVQSVDWEARMMKNSGGRDSVDYDYGILYDGVATPLKSIDFVNRQAFDATEVLSVDYTARKLHDSTGAEILDFSSIIDITGNVQQDLGDYWYKSSTAGDAVDDIRIKDSAGAYIVEKCTVANATKGAGTWVEIFNSSTNVAIKKVDNFFDWKGSTYTMTTSGLLVVGEIYEIGIFVAGDDFTNVADVIYGTINTDGCVFRATGTTPTVWTNSSEIVTGVITNENEVLNTTGRTFDFYSTAYATKIIIKSDVDFVTADFKLMGYNLSQSLTYAIQANPKFLLVSGLVGTDMLNSTIEIEVFS